jgi:hypothetical protein
LRTPAIRKKLDSWLASAERPKLFIDEHSDAFHKWSPLKFYVTFGYQPWFSILYEGQEVASLCFPKKDKYCPTVKLTASHLKSNIKYFGLHSSEHQFEWKSKEGNLFRRHFRNGHFPGHSVEKLIEGRLIAGLIAKNKPENSTLRNRTAVTIDRFALQFPVPFSACKGKVGKREGHIDILGRKRESSDSFLSVWELKAPGAYGSAARQAYIYAAQIQEMISDQSSASRWRELFGFSAGSTVPKIEIVLGLSKSLNDVALSDIRALRNESESGGCKCPFSWTIANYADDLDVNHIKFLPVP